MKIGITKLIAENIAPDNVKGLAIYDGDKKICDVDITKMKPNLSEPLYSFGLLSDIHMTGDSNAGTKEKDGNGYITDGFYFRKALDFFSNSGCNFVCISGDLTDVGLFGYTDENTKSEYYYYYPDQFEEYKAICDLFPNLHVYGCCGNHENYVKNIEEVCADKWEKPTKVNGTWTWVAKPEPWAQIDSSKKLKYYTGTPLYYTISAENTSETSAIDGVNSVSNGGNIQLPLVDVILNQTDDVFIFFGQSTPIANSTWTFQIDWLEATLEANKNKRCFVFEHLTLNNDSGNPENVHNTYWGDLESRLVSILSKYPNTILFHGHSHMQFQEQLKVTYSNYSTNRGFKSVHIPSTSYTRKLVDQNGDGIWNAGDKENIPDGSQGYICDVYENCIVLKGYDFQTNEFVPIAQYCIDTTL
ncbi:MAG: metallophosphoesterase [Clostridia bacterium]|nr:metallophosphoesterase [Clostridia bacterium]